MSYTKPVQRTANKIKNRIEIMRKILSCFVIILMSFPAMAEHHGEENAALHAAIKSFNHTYATNDVETYFSFYADDATVYFGGGSRVDMAAYHDMWTELMEAGGGVLS